MATMQRLEAALNEWQQWEIPLTAKPEIIAQLKGGLTNQLYVIKNNHNFLVLRLNNHNSAKLGINRKHEAIILHALEPLHIAPRLMHSDYWLNYSIFEHISGQPYNANTVSADINSNLQQAIKQIQEITHLDLPRFNYQDHISAYWAQLKRSQQTMLKSQWSSFFQQLSEFQQSNWKPVLSHHDLNSNNILLQNNTIRILDWEYAGMGHPDIDRYVTTGLCETNPFIADIVYWMEKLWFMLNE